MSLDFKAIYELLPAFYRTRDAELAEQLGSMLDDSETAELQNLLSIAGSLSAKKEHRLEELQALRLRGPLAAMMAVLAEQVKVLEGSLEQAYDDQFIETCQEWLVPYIGDLVGARGLFVYPNATFSARARAADTLALRRSKGTVYAIERLAREVTGWDANVVEYFQVLATTQYMQHIRKGNLSISDVRRASHEPLNTPFDPYARTADVRNISPRRGKYNIPNIGIFLWRIPSMPMKNSPAFRVDDRRYLFDAVGRDIPLHTFSQPEDPGTARATPFNVPMRLGRRRMYDDPSGYYGVGPKGETKSILIFGGGIPLPGPISVCDLGDWSRQPQNSIGIDPELGRIAFPLAQAAPANVHVSYFYGFSAPMGGGQYPRDLRPNADVFIKVPEDFPSIQGALDFAVSRVTGDRNFGIIEIKDNEYYIETPQVAIPAQCEIELRAADGKRPVLVLAGDFRVIGGNQSKFSLNGLMVTGGALAVPAIKGPGDPNLLARLELTDCTLLPSDTARIWISSVNTAFLADKSIVGAIRIDQNCSAKLTNTIVDALAKGEVAYAARNSVDAGGPLELLNCTVIGKVHALRLSASNTIFLAELPAFDLWTAPVLADQLQQGCVRFSYVPPGSKVPRPYRCPSPAFPAFASLRCGDPGYCSLEPQSGQEIIEGADDQSEMGAFHDLYRPQRGSNLRSSLQEFLRFGLEGGIFYAS
ncbi:MAG TPA: hypothetical protein VEX68_21625 [Bryobacteraceae bacterium]|nr:hypothetical protein [Bryobacteraceae bacterium]